MADMKAVFQPADLSGCVVSAVANIRALKT
jgi:hypothetical protein